MDLLFLILTGVCTACLLVFLSLGYRNALKGQDSPRALQVGKMVSFCGIFLFWVLWNVWRNLP